MGVYTRFKRDPGGMRQLVELLETTPPSRRQKMIDVGMKEDPDYTQQALQYVYSFSDITSLPDMELAEVLGKVQGKLIAFALHGVEQPVKDRFLKCMKPAGVADARDFFDAQIGNAEINGARLKIIAAARDLEKKGLVKTKRIP